MKTRNKPRADGRFVVYVEIGRDENGKRVRKPCYGKTQAEAEAKANELKIKVGRGLDISSSRDSFMLWANRWLDRQEGKRLSETWLVNCRGYVKYLNEAIGYYEIQQVRVNDIQDIINAIAKRNPNTGRPSSHKLLTGLRSAARGIFRYAIESRVIEFNPADYVHLPKITPEKKEHRALSDIEISWIRITEHAAQTMAMIMTFAGMRRGEIIPLLWTDFDLAARTVHINKSVTKVGNTFVVKSGAKTAAGERIVDIPQILVDYLSTIPRTSIYICPRSNGSMHTEMSFRRLWESYMKTLNREHGDFTSFANRPKSKFDPKGTPFIIQGFTPHDCRHTFCTILYHSGVDVLVAAAQMGHADPKVTLEIYTHLDKTFKRKNMAKLDDFLANKRFDGGQMAVRSF
jgi:integrase